MLRPVNLAAFGRSLIAGRSVTGDFSDADIMTDPVLCDVMLENMLDNARKHGHPEDPSIKCSITADATTGKQCIVTFQVTNRPKAGAKRIPADIVSRVVRLGSAREFSTSALSDGLGLKHSFLAAGALEAKYRFWQDQDLVTFQAKLTADLVIPETTVVTHTDEGQPSSDLEPVPVPTGVPLKIFCIEDSGLMRRWLVSCLTACGEVRAFGATADEVEEALTLGRQVSSDLRLLGPILRCRFCATQPPVSTRCGPAA